MGFAFHSSSLLDYFKLGKRFVDSKGGRIKRDIERVVTNATAIVPIDEEHLRVVFEANYCEVEYPIYGIGSFFSFGKKPGG